MNKRIVYNRHHGGVWICCPTDWVISMMGCGGSWKEHGFIERQIESQIARGIRADAARRYAMAMQFGGCTTAESLEIIRDRDCAPHGTAIELWDLEDIPVDRWFRDAWRRSHNGGPISIDLKLAKPIQWRRARGALVQENKRRDDDMGLPLEVDWDRIRSQIQRASEEQELRAIWPCELPKI